MATNNIKPIASGTTPDVISQEEFEALPDLSLGFPTGMLPRRKLNKVLKQSSLMSAAVAQVIVARGVSVSDTMTATEIATALVAAILTGVPSDISLMLAHVPNVAALRGMTAAGPHQAFLMSYYVSGDGGGGAVYMDPSDTASPDDGLSVFVASDGSRWKRVIVGMLSIRQCGVTPAQGGATNSTRLQAAIDWASPRSHCLYVPEGTYTFSAPVSKAQSFSGLSMKGAGRDKCRFEYTTLAADVSFMTIIGGSGYVCGSVIEGIGFKGVTGSPTTHGTTAVEIRGQCGQKLVECQFSENHLGVLFHNAAPGSFTEYCVAQSCDFQGVCSTPVEYRKTSGNQSFHGSGLSQRCTVNTKASGTATVMLVGADCLVYNAPLDVQVWGHTATVLIQNNNTGTPAVHNCNWSGELTFEPFSGGLTLANGHTRTYFTGTINSISQQVSYGVLKHADAIIVNSDGNVRVLPKPASKHGIALTTGATTIDVSSWWSMTPSPVAGQSGATKAYIFISGPNYYYAHELTLVHNPYGGAGSAQIVSTLFNNNVAAWGAPTYAFDSSDRIVITNGLYPPSGVTCDISLSPIGWAQP